MQLWERNLEDNLFKLHAELKYKIYRHSDYTAFYITDPKQRHIHKADVRDRILHHAVYRVLYPIFDKSFIFDSYSCRLNKGTHKAVARLENFARKVSKNYTSPCFGLKCDIKKFFDSVDHTILYEIVERRIGDKDVLWLLREIIDSFNLALPDVQIERERERRPAGRGIPIGNLTSQLFANIYLNELDKFIKHELRCRNYLRYCDDFVILSSDLTYLENIVPEIEKILKNRLKLKLHKDKITIRKLRQGIDFLGYVVLPNCKVLRTKTKRRMLERANSRNLPSYLGLLKHCNSHRLTQGLIEKFSPSGD